MSQNNIWVGEKDLTKDKKFIDLSDQEFKQTEQKSTGQTIEEGLSLEGGRRDFLKMLGFGISAATVAAGCDIPVKRAIPYVVKPENIVPGVATYYASSFVEGGSSMPILVKTREGRPIKIESNNLLVGHTLSSAKAQASVLDLYNTNRYKSPQFKTNNGFKDVTWAEVDKKITAAMSAAKNIRLVTSSIGSPFTNSVVNELTSKYSNLKVVSYDSISAAAMLEANAQSYGARIIPNYHFDKADVILSFDADFLGAWAGGCYEYDYISNRRIKDVKNPQMSRHIQVETHMSLTGSNADNRILVKPSEMGAAIAFLANEIVGGVSAPGINDKAKQGLRAAAAQLKAAGSKALVVSGSNNVSEQLLINAINHALGAEGTTVGLSGVSMSKQGDERELEVLTSELDAGYVDLVIFNQCNPLYDYVGAAALKAALAKAENVVALSYAPNETSTEANVIAPVNHFLENWGDTESNEGLISVIQPTINRLFDTRQVEESLMAWMGMETNGTDGMLSSLKESWKTGAFAKQNTYLSFDAFWENALKDGGVRYTPTNSYAYTDVNVGEAARNINKPENSELEIKFYATHHIGNGSSSDNPWLMEMPDPVTRTSWGNYLAVPVNFDGVRKMKGFNGLEDGDLVEITVGEKTMTVPVMQQFGQMPGTVALAMGYGRSEAGPVGTDVGVDVNDLMTINKGRSQGYNSNVSVSGKVGKEKDFSCVQYHHTYGVKAEDKDGEVINADEAALGVAYGLSGYQGALTDRSVMYTSSVKDLPANLEKLHEKRKHAQHLNDNGMYPTEEYTEKLYSQGHHWGMHVDLNACTGCGACTVACMAENNVPVVGKREVGRHHEMTWLRIDRYYYGDIESPNVVYQPMMCQHCDNAPCENVCPVNATNHSSEGLNQMTYNRCVGTRYCANNCPYKVRRFNWLDYTTADLFPVNQIGLGLDTEVPFYGDNLTRMVLNPDVTVRARGVIEKCSFCVQRLQEGKLTAKVEGRKLEDSDVTPACAAACTAGAITFGDKNNKKGDLGKTQDNPLNFISLEEVNVLSSVTYTMKVNNRDEALDA